MELSGPKPLLDLSDVKTSGVAVDFGYSRTIAVWRCCGLEEDVTDRPYIYPNLHRCSEGKS